MVHAVADRPTGPYALSDIAMASAHTNPQIMRTPNGHWLLYSQATCAHDQYDHVCTGCHKGHCGPEECDKPSRFPPLHAGDTLIHMHSNSHPIASCDAFHPIASSVLFEHAMVCYGIGGAGNLSFSRRERPKMLFDKNGTPTHLFNSADPGGSVPWAPNPGWQHNSRPFTMVTEILSS